VRSYLGTAYSAKRNPEFAAAEGSGGDVLYLDCCGLVRRCLLDLKEDFGFEVGPWNQSYLFDTLPQDLADEPGSQSSSRLKPGDLIFWTAEYDDPSKPPQKHDLVHIEVYVGDGPSGEGTIGSRYEGPGVTSPGVAAFESYRSFAGHLAHGHQLLFRSIDTWLDGICVSHCAMCSWGEPPKKVVRSKLFAPAEEAAEGGECCIPISDECGRNAGQACGSAAGVVEEGGGGSGGGEALRARVVFTESMRHMQIRVGEAT